MLLLIYPGFYLSIILDRQHELCFCFAESDNPLNDELGEDQYMNITIEQELNFPDPTFLTSVLSVAQVKSHLHSICERHKPLR